MASIPPSALEEVYAVPPKEFTRTRNARMAALARSGHHDAADALRRLRRPAATLWAINQLGRAGGTQLDAFVDAVERLRRAQLRDPRAVGDAAKQQRAALERLLDVARKQLGTIGVKASPGAVTRIANTLQGAAVDPRRAEELRHGRLTEELAAPGFEVFAGARPARLTVVPGGKPADSAKHQRDAERQARRQAAGRARARKAEERARAAEERARMRRERQAAATETAREVEALAEKLAEARKRLAKLRR